MTKPLALPERQITALIRGAAKVGHIAEVKVGDVWRPLQAVYPPVILICDFAYPKDKFPC